MINSKALLVFLLLAAFMPASAAIYIVPGDYFSIQTAVDGVLDGDTVLAVPGTYYENVNFGTKSIALGSFYLLSGDTSYITSTIIDGSSLNSVVTIASGQDSTTILTGFTIQHGYNSNNGGGILLGASPKILHNRITLNVAANQGGGIYCSGGTPIIEYNDIIDNAAGGTFNKGGGAIYCYYSGARVSHNMIAENTGSIGGAIATYDCNPIFTYNVIRNNSAPTAGGGISCFSSGHWNYPVISYNVIAENTAQMGAGVYASMIDPTINNNTFYHNICSWKGGGLACDYSATPAVTNNIFWADSTAAAGNEIAADFTYPGYPVVTYCDIQDTLWAGEGNISCDPQLCAPDSGNFYLAYVSCCVGSGQGGADIGVYGVGCGPYPIPAIVSIVPSQNGMNISLGSNISVAFDTDMDPATFNYSNFVVYGMYGGLIEGALTYDSPSRTATYAPWADFPCGEVITVVLSEGILSEHSIPMDDPYGWSFTVTSLDGYGTFAPRSDYSIGSRPSSVTAGDFDNDGDLDIATSNILYNNISIILNNGDGTFAAHSDYSTANTPMGIHAADYDGDGYLDLATANESNASVSVLLNNGSAGFPSHTEYATGANPMDVFGADLDGDGDVDLATANRGSNSATVLFNNGNGTFGSQAGLPVGNWPYAVTSSDLDNDGDYDLAVANRNSNHVSILLNYGDGTFAPDVFYWVGTYPYSIYTADLDGDGDNDLVTTNATSNNVSVLLNYGNGTFANHVDYAVVSEPYSVHAADLDGDGDLDLAVTNWFNDNISVLMNNGNGTFAAQVAYAADSRPSSIVAGDFDGDGDMDLAASNNYSSKVSILLNENPPVPQIVSFSPGMNELNVAANTDITVTFDIDMDQATINDSTYVVNGMSTGLHAGAITYDSLSKTATFDPTVDFAPGEVVTVVLTTGMESLEEVSLENSHTRTFTVETAGGSGDFAQQVVYSVDYAPNSIFASDLDGDGDMDLSTPNTGSFDVSVLLNNGNGTFADDVTYVSGTSPYSVFASDLDGDGDIDLAVADTGSTNISVLLNNGNGTFAAEVNYSAGDYTISIFGSDFDGDGDIDLVTIDLYSYISVIMNNGDGTFAAPVMFYLGGYISSVFAADFDGDGYVDLAAPSGLSDISILISGGDGTFATPAAYSIGSYATAIFGADLDSDGYIDLAASVGDTTVSVLINNGDGTFAPYVSYTVGSYPRSVFAPDLDGDGDLDLVTANYYSDDISVLFNNGDGTFASHVTFAVGDAPGAVFASDLDGDGDLDLATANSSSNDVSVLLNNNPSGAIAGTVTDDAANPLEGVIVSAMGTVFQDTTDVSGDYSLDSLDVGTYNISFHHQDYFDTVVTGVQVNQDETTDLDVIMVEIPGILVGTVTNPDGLPVESVYVEISSVTISSAGGNEGYPQSAGESINEEKSEPGLLLDVVDSLYTDLYGFYAVQLPAGTYDVSFSHADYRDTTCSDVVLTPGYVTVLNVQLALAGCEYVTGDVNGSDSYNGLDITYGVGFFKGGNDPMCTIGSCPISPCDLFFYCGDVNGSCSYNGLDITYGVAYFKGGSGPVSCADCLPLGIVSAVSSESGAITKNIHIPANPGKSGMPEKRQK